MISNFNKNQSTVHPLSSRNVLKDIKPSTSVFQIASKNTFHVQDTSREFGKDITNVNLLTVNIQNENTNTVINSKLNASLLEKKMKHLSKQKEDLTQKLKNYDIKVQTFKHPMKSQTLRSVIGTKDNGNGNNSGDDDMSDITMRYNNIVNNDIMTGECLTRYTNDNANGNHSHSHNHEHAHEVNRPIEEMDVSDEEIATSSSISSSVSIPVLNNKDNIDVDPGAGAGAGENIIPSNPQFCKDYIKDIHTHLRATEHQFHPKCNYMSNQPDINEKMRGILIDWLIEVHLKYKLVPETMFLTVNLIDRYLEQKPIMRTRLQLVGVASMFIACKYEEIFAPEVRDFVYITDNAYKKSEVIEMESDILLTLNYNVTVPSSYRFLEVYSNFLQFDQTIFHFAWYLLELALVDIKMLKYHPSLLAASAVLIALKMMKMYTDNDFDEVTGFTEDKLKDCSKDICASLQNTEKVSLQAIRKKFSLSKYHEVSKIKYL